MNQTSFFSRFSNPLRLVIGVVVILSLSLWVFYLLLNPPMNDMGLMAVFLTLTAAVSALASYAAYKLGWINRSPTIRWTLMGIYVLSSILTFLNIWITARLMFASRHDLLLATVLLFFASGIAVVMGYFFSNALTDRIEQLDLAAKSIARGKLDTRIPISGRDEIAELGNTFNEMAVQLQSADQKKRQLNDLRRDLIAWISHDLQTPLASIRAIVEALADNMVEDEDTVHRYLLTAKKDIGALSELIDDLFQMAQLDTGAIPLEYADNSLSDLISDTLESFSTLAERKNIQLHGKVAPEVDPVWMDAQRIGRALNNLISNALTYTDSGGRVDVQAFLSSEYIVVEVSDTGEGIPPEDVPNIFERFYRSEKSRSRATGGAGLGLAIARGIVEAHKGTISVESVQGEFTRFSMFIPKNLEDI